MHFSLTRKHFPQHIIGARIYYEVANKCFVLKYFCSSQVSQTVVQ